MTDHDWARLYQDYNYERESFFKELKEVIKEATKQGIIEARDAVHD